MSTAEFLVVLAQLSGVGFVITSMLAMGMNLTMAMILQPLRNGRLVIMSLAANFLLVPLLAYVIVRVIPLEQPLQIGLIVLSTAAGAPFLPKLVQVARGNIAFGVGLMAMLMVVTVAYMPLVLPLLLPGVSVNPWDIAKSLIVLMLVPLAIGLLIRSHSPETASDYAPLMSKVSSLCLVLILVVGLGLNVSNIIALVGTGGIVALLAFIVGSLAIGYLLGGSDPSIRSVTGLGTAQRNVAAAILVSAQSFGGTMTLPFVLVAAILLLLVLLPVSKRFAAGSEAPGHAEETSPQAAVGA